MVKTAYFSQFKALFDNFQLIKKAFLVENDTIPVSKKDPFLAIKVINENHVNSVECDSRVFEFQIFGF